MVSAAESDERKIRFCEVKIDLQLIPQQLFKYTQTEKNENCISIRGNF